MTNKKHQGLSTGIIFTILSLLMLLTYVIPIISVIPGMIIESIAEAFLLNETSSEVGKLTIVFLTLILIGTIVLLFVAIKNRVIESGRIPRKYPIFFMLITYFIVHSLGAYIYWWAALNFKVKEPVMFYSLDSFLYSSFAFIPLGILFDSVINKTLSKRSIPL